MSVDISFDSKSSHIRIQGELTSKTVMHALGRLNKECNKLSDWAIDLSSVTRVDSSALALLIELKREARKNNKNISFIDLPSALIAIARLSQVDELLTVSQ